MKRSIPDDTLSIPLIKDIDDMHNKEKYCWEPVSCLEIGLNVTLYVMLFVQFGIFFYLRDQAVESLRLSVIVFSIVVFILDAYLYHRSVADVGIQTDMILLLPEFLTVLCLGLICFSQVVAGFFVLLAGTLVLSTAVITINGYRLYSLDPIRPESLMNDEDVLLV